MFRPVFGSFLGPKKLGRRRPRPPKTRAPRENSRKILDNKVLNCYYRINTDSILAASPLPSPIPLSAGPEIPSSGPFHLYPRKTRFSRQAAKIAKRTQKPHRAPCSTTSTGICFLLVFLGELGGGLVGIRKRQMCCSA